MKAQQEDHTSNMETMESKHEKLTIMVEKFEESFQRKYEISERLQMSIEEKETMDAVKAAADVLCHKQVEDVNDIQKVQEIFEAKEAEMPKTQSLKECMIVIAVEVKTLQESVQGGSAIVAEETKRVQKMTKKKAEKVYRGILRHEQEKRKQEDKEGKRKIIDPALVELLRKRIDENEMRKRQMQADRKKFL